MRILVVDDDPLVRWSVRRLLPRFAVDESASAAEALVAVAERHYDALIVDQCLSGPGNHSGLWLADTLRAQSWAGALVLISGFSGPEFEREAMRAGADAFFPKVELDRARLRSVIEHAVAARSSAGAREETDRASRLQQAVRDVLDCGADEEGAHAQKAYHMALFAKEALGVAEDAMSVGTCARLLGVTVETLRKHALVASRWSAPELRRLLLERRGPKDYRISISHLYELARVPTGLRETWLERCFDRRLSVRALQMALGDARPRGADAMP
jgi:DNA-binding NarL/FixJ family response regulator